MTDLSIKGYEVSPSRGFLCQYDADSIKLPSDFDVVVEVAEALPKLVPTGRVRSHIDQLPVLDLTEFCLHASDAQIRSLMVRYTFLIQVYVWGEADVVDTLPECLAKPCWQLSQHTKQPPLLTYSNYVLDNWAKINPEGPISLDNIYMIQPFIGGQDEAWFVLIHVAIEASAGKMLIDFPKISNAAVNHDLDTIHAGLANIATTWKDLNAIFDRMPERCDPYVYFNRVRPWIHGWKDNPALPNGVTYTGVEDNRALNYRGQTGSQSSIVPAVDALFGINHADDPLRHFLDELHSYRPVPHQQFISDLRANSVLRQTITDAGEPQLIELYNQCLDGLAQFRSKHLEYAASYIAKQNQHSGGNSTDVGTGGTPFMRYLRKHRDEVNQHKL